MTEKKKTEILFGFEHHTPLHTERHEENMKEADVILLEIPPSKLKKLLSKTPTEIEKKYPDMLKHTREYVLKAKKYSNEGKEVKGWDSKVIRGKSWWWEMRKNPKSIRSLPIQMQMFYTVPRIVAEATVARENRAFKFIKNNLPKWEGKKVYIMAGGFHTGLYHKLKKELESKGVEVRREHFAKGNYEHPRIHEKFDPMEQLAGMIRFKLKSAKDPTRVEELYNQWLVYAEEINRLKRKHGALAVREQDEAFKKDEFKLLRRQTRRGLK